jgi:Outer membrane protein beta-barrel domain
MEFFMKKSLSLLTIIQIFFLTLLIIPCTNYAQFKLKVGPNLGMNFNLHTGSDVESGSGLGMVIGGTVDMQFTPTIGLIANLQFYDNRSGSISQTGSQQYNDGQGGTVSSTITVDNSISLAYFVIEPLFKLNVRGSGFYFFMGPSIGFNVEGSSEAVYTETFPPPFNNNDQKKTSKSTLKDLLVRFEIKAGGGYDIWLSNSVVLSPQLSFGYGITKVIKDVSYRVLTIQALGTVKFAL